MDRIAYLDIVAVPIYFVILFACFVRKMVYGPSNKLFIGLVTSSMITAICDAVSGIVASDAPLNSSEVTVVSLATGLYHVFHSLTPILFLLFLMAETRTWYHMTQKHRLLITFIPYAVLLLLIIVNLFTGIVFTVTPDEGYVRGPAIYAFYGGAVIYSLWGIMYLFRRRRMLTNAKWMSLLMMYVLNIAAVVFQMIHQIFRVYHLEHDRCNI